MNNPAIAAFAIFQTTSNPTAQGFQTLPIGAGGYNIGIDIECDTGPGNCAGSGTSTKVIRTDTYGSYIWQTTGSCQGANIVAPCWQQLVTTVSMPVGDPTNNPTACINSTAGCGVWEIRIAPSNTNIAYMMINGYVYTTSNLHGGTNLSWVATGFTQDTSSAANTNSSARYAGHKLAIDPVNPSNVIACTGSNGCFKTTNGGTSWTAITGITNSSTVMAVDFDPSSSTGGSTPNLYIASSSTGVYKCTGGLLALSCALTTSSPTAIQFMTITLDGTVYLVDSVPSNNLHIFTAGAWITKSPGSFNSSLAGVAIDPQHQTFASNAYITLVSGSGQAAYSQTSGTTWSGITTPSGGGVGRIATDIPWLAFTNENFLAAAQIAYDPAQANVVFFTTGIGTWVVTPILSWTSSSNVGWTSQNKGIEQLVANKVLSPWTSGSVPTVYAWDRPTFYASSTTTYPSTHGAANPTANSIISGWDADWASSAPATLGVIADFAAYENGLSSNGGSTWSLLNPPSGLTGLPSGGSIALGSASCIVWIPGNSSSVGFLNETSNGGTSWTIPTISGISATAPAGWTSSYFLVREIVTADRVNSCTFYAYNSGAHLSSSSTSGIYKGVYNGSTWAWSLARSGNLDAGDGFNAKLRSVPGVAGDMFYTSGEQSGIPSAYPHAQSFWECQDTSGTVACTAISNIREVWTFGYGAAKPGGSGYPSIYIVGWANCGQTGINNCPSGATGYTYGVWRSTDHTATWNYLNNAPINSLDYIKTIEGDANTYGLFYIGWLGSGFAFGQF